MKEFTHIEDLKVRFGWFGACLHEIRQEEDYLREWFPQIRDMEEGGSLIFCGTTIPYRADCKTKCAVNDILYVGKEAYRYQGVIGSYNTGVSRSRFGKPLTGYVVAMRRLPNMDLVAEERWWLSASSAFHDRPRSTKWDPAVPKEEAIAMFKATLKDETGHDWSVEAHHSERWVVPAPHP